MPVLAASRFAVVSTGVPKWARQQSHAVQAKAGADYSTLPPVEYWVVDHVAPPSEN
jgi:hypothetical protein